jgi:hypothetical protein
MTTLIIVLVLAGGAWYFLRRMGQHDRVQQPAAENSGTSVDGAPQNGPLVWPSKGEFACEVVGESNYQAAIERVHNLEAKQSDDTPLLALLTPESGNKHDRNAVNVTIGGEVVGYLSRDFAPVYRERLKAEGMGLVPVYCHAQITGGFQMDDGQRASFGVELDIDEFEES